MWYLLTSIQTPESGTCTSLHTRVWIAPPRKLVKKICHVSLYLKFQLHVGACMECRIFVHSTEQPKVAVVHLLSRVSHKYNGISYVHLIQKLEAVHQLVHLRKPFFYIYIIN